MRLDTLILVVQTEIIGLIIGIDRLLDMVRTAVNVTGDATASVVVASSEGQLDERVYMDPHAARYPDRDDDTTAREAA